MKNSTFVKYLLFAVMLYIFALIVSLSTGWLLSSVSIIGDMKDSMGVLEGTVSAFTTVFVLHQLKQGELVEKKQNDFEEANFILQVNKSFIQDPQMFQVEHALEEWMEGKRDVELINDSNRQLFVNYLVYLESLIPLLERNILVLNHIDDLMAYRYFLAVNNPVLQEDQLFRYPEYFRGCLRYYQIWKNYRIQRGYEILLEDFSLDKWEFYKNYATKDIIVRKAIDTDNFEKIASLIYETDSYIYPTAFESEKNAQKIIPELIKNNYGIFNKDNIWVALKDNEIVGISLIIKEFNEMKKDTNLYYTDAFGHVLKHYFNKLSECVGNDKACVVCLCIDKKHRGNHYSELLLNIICEKYKDYNLILDVLKDNKYAIKAYKQCKFEVVREVFEGYCLHGVGPDCLRMKKQKYKS